MEKKLQSKIIKFLKDNGAYVLKTTPVPGIPVGCPDIIALYGNTFAAIEVKADPTSRYRPGQGETLDFLRRGSSFVYRADPTTWPGIKAELELLFFC